jgi:Cysteine-rich secretory protein family
VAHLSNRDHVPSFVNELPHNGPIPVHWLCFSGGLGRGGKRMRGTWVVFWLSWTSICVADPAQSISAFRHEHGLSKVQTDPALMRLAREQAEAMAAANKLDHGVRASFPNRMSAYATGHAAENIAMGNTTFPATLEQWKRSPGHRANLLLRDVSRIGIASAGSGNRTYWSLVLAAAPKPRPAKASVRPAVFMQVPKDSRRLLQ